MTNTFTPIAIEIAGIKIGDAAGEIIKYLESENTKDRVKDFDFAAYERRNNFSSGDATLRIDKGTITSAQFLFAQFERTLKLAKPAAEALALEWFSTQERTAPWNSLATSDEFVRADPLVIDGLHDRMVRLWQHFSVDSPKGIGPTQVNKVLHQVFPSLVPIYDGKLHQLYEGKRLGRAVKSARRLESPNNALTGKDKFSWEPLRRDMAEVTESKFEEIRFQVKTRPCMNSLILEEQPANVWASINLSDVRLIDMIAWQIN
jgi:hypothetical protein